VNNRVVEFSDEGTLGGSVGGGQGQAAFDLPYGVALAPDDGLYVIEYGGGRVCLVAPDGSAAGTFGSPGHGKGQFRTPWGLAADGRRVIVADTGNSRIVEILL
jgi:DNA-binding beta-propeller fold protein YncE